MAGANFSGLASGLDTNALVELLLTNQQRRYTGIENRIRAEDRKRTAFSELDTLMDGFKDTLDDLEDSVFKVRKVESSDEDLFTAEATSSGAPTGDYKLKVKQLATRSSASIGGELNSASEVIGAGSLTINTAGGNYSVTLSDSGSTLTDLREKINEDHGDDLQANILEVEPGKFQLVVSSKNSGSDVNIEGTSSHTFADNATFNAASVVSTQTGQNAIFKVDGVEIERETNEIDDVINGITLSLKGISADYANGTEETLKVQTDFSEMKTGLKTFVDKYNAAIKKVSELTGAGGTLSGDTGIRSLRTDLQALISRAVPNADKVNVRDDGSVGFTSLSQIGFKTDRKTGELSIEDDDLEEALTEHFDEVKTLFLGGYKSNNANVTMESNTLGEPFSGTIDLNTLTDQASFDGVSESMTRNGSVFTFSNTSSHFGMVLTAGVNQSGLSLEVSAGIGAILGYKAEEYGGFGGILKDRQDSVDSKKRGLESSLESSQNRLDNERTRLTRIFAKSEQAISALQGLQSSLGATTSFRR